MKNPQNKHKKDVFVAIILTESTSSLLKLDVPHLDTVHPQNSKVCVITPVDELNKDFLKNIKKNESRHSNKIKKDESKYDMDNIYSKIASEEIAVFSTSNCSSSSRMYVMSKTRPIPRLVRSWSCVLFFHLYLVLQTDMILGLAATVLLIISKLFCADVSEEFDNNAHSSDNFPSSSNNFDEKNLFEIAKTKNYPLVTMRSKAHSNKLNMWGKDIYVTTLDTDSSRSSAEFICRICHGGESLEDLLTPCRCRGTVALVHLKCLERWLRESNHSSCELCQHHYVIVREAKYSIPWSIIVFLRHPGPHLKEILLDLFAFAVYTPSAVASTYMLLMICEALIKSNLVTVGSLSSHIIAFSAVFGMAIIDFTYSSWLITSIQKHVEAWSEWYKSNSRIKVILPRIKMRPHRVKRTP